MPRVLESTCHAPLAIMIRIRNLRNLFRRGPDHASSAYDFAPVGLATFSESNQSLTRCNPLFSELLGYTSCNDCIDDFSVEYHLEDGALNQAALSELRDTNSLLGKEVSFKTVAGEYQSVKCNVQRHLNRQCIEIAIFPPMDEADQLNTDTTELQLARQDNNQLQNQLFQARKMHTMGQLTGGFAHDFNNLLASVIGYTGLVLDKSRDILDPQIKDYLSEVYRAGQQGQKLSSVALEIHVDEQVPSVATNAFKLNQILMNLCINAKDAMDGIGTLCIDLESIYQENAECSCCGESVTGQFVQIQIADSGIGISNEMLPHIFDPYFTTKEIGRGTGVGLSMVDNLMHEHGGHVQVVSRPRLGTTFKLLFPPCQQISSEATTIHLGKSKYQALHSGHILVVDDDRSVGTYVAEVLKHHGHKVTLEFNSVKALARYQDSPYVFDCVVTDQTMPEMTGSRLMLAMKELREEIPVIICTAYSENLNEASALKAGAKGYLGKPIDVDRLIELVDQSLAQYSSTAA
jgi:signal transduction histidine kinase/ActR/RegA family two-component response regulator